MENVAIINERGPCYQKGYRKSFQDWFEDYQQITGTRKKLEEIIPAEQVDPYAVKRWNA